MLKFKQNINKRGDLFLTNDQSKTREITFSDPNIAVALFGVQNKHLTLLEDALDLSIGDRGGDLSITGAADNVQLAIEILTTLEDLLRNHIAVGESDVINAIRMAEAGDLAHFIDIYQVEIVKAYGGKPIRTKNLGQYNYYQAATHNDIAFGIGPAGTGKTFIAVSMAVAALKRGQVKRIILTRPAVEAGESLGFLPGDLKEKVDPYLRPLYDALYEILGREHTTRLMERETIEIAPLAYMRGRTLDDAFVILDEAQNTTMSQMKMFLTRLGFGSKMIINGDLTQIDLLKSSQSGLVHAQKVLRDVKGIEMVHFNANDVVRHPLVARIISAYAKEDKNIG